MEGRNRGRKEDKRERRGGKKKKGERKGEKEIGRKKGRKKRGRKEGRKKLSFSWVQASKKRCIMVVSLWVRKTRVRHNEGGKKKEEGVKRREG